MKTSTQTIHLASLALTLAALLLHPQPAHCFYNPTTGRWLNRDPLQESGGLNVNAFVANRPTEEVDRDGRDMILRVYTQELPRPPWAGDYADWMGLTYFQPFAPRTLVYKKSNCCWKIYLTGHAYIYSWWVRGATTPHGSPVREHEMVHVAIHRDTFDSFVADASDYTGTCLPENKARCFAAVITGAMKEAWLDHNHTENLQFDCTTTGRRCDEIPDAQQKEIASWAQLASALSTCASLQ